MDPGGQLDRQWCEYAVPNFLPSLRSSIVFALSQRFGLSQRQIARRLGLSQAAVSHYVTYRRGGRTPLMSGTGLSEYAESLARRVVAGLSGPRLTAAICGVCTSYRQSERVGPCFCISEGVSKADFLASLGDGIGFPKQPCESFVFRRLLPLIRSQMAQNLAERRSQNRIASLLGVSQPAVSQYLSSKRGEDSLAVVGPGLSERVEDLAESLEEGLSTDGRKTAICRICVESRKRGLARARAG